MMWEPSKCTGGWLHRWETYVDTPAASIEQCTICKGRRVYRVAHGRVHNYHYARTHIRSALQPGHKLFAREYGNG